MKKLYFVLCFAILGLCANAQPANDDCVDAESIVDPSDFCDNYTTDNFTYDSDPGTCGPNLLPANMWYSFVAVGSDLSITVTFGPNEISVINLYSVDPSDPCNTLSGNLCSDNGELNATGLVLGLTYYYSISILDRTTGDPVNTSFEMCIENLSIQMNNDPCLATDIIVGGCLSGESNAGTNANLNLSGLCATANESQLWYTTTLNPGSHILTVEVNGAGAEPITGDLLIVVLQFNGGCTGGAQLVSSYCGPANTFVEFYNLTPGDQYYIGIVTSEIGEGQFEICTSESGPDPCVGAQNECGPGASSLFPITPPVGQVPTPFCIQGCIDNATNFDDFGFSGACGFEFNNSTVWYNIQTDANAVTMNIEISNLGGLQQGAAALMSYDCNNAPIVIDCNIGNAQEIQLIDINIMANTSYVLAITDLVDHLGEFDLCLNTLPASNPCNRVFSIEEVNSNVAESPLEGPYCPGEEVEFCIDVTSFFQGFPCQWLQGIIPFFGEGWDPASFDAQGMPTTTVDVTPVGGGTWDWYVDNDVDYNVDNAQIHVMSNIHGLFLCSPINDFDCSGVPLSAGVGLPRGWYAYDPSDGNGQSGHPDVDWGDGNGCNNNAGPWKVCFTLIARDYPDCSQSTDFSDASVGVMIFADGETGSYTSQQCIGQLPLTVSASVACNDVPVIMTSNTEICSGETFVIALTSSLDPLTYEWTANAPPQISGASNGSGPTISQTLTNSSNGPLDVIYEVTGTKTACPGFADVTVTVNPDVAVDLQNLPASGCALQEFDLGTYINVGTGQPPFSYQWSNGSNLPNPQVQLSSTTTFSVTVTDAVGCQGEASFDVTIFALFNVIIDGLSVVCSSELDVTLTANPQGGQAPYQSFDWILPDGVQLSNVGDIILANQNGLYSVVVIDNEGCPGLAEFTLTINENPESVIAPFPTNAVICGDAEVQMFDVSVSGSSPTLTKEWIVPPGFFGDVTINGFPTNVPGDYTLIVVDANGCSDTFTQTLTLIPAAETNNATLTVCFETSGIGVFDLTSVDSIINDSTNFDIDYFSDDLLMNQIPQVDLTSYSSVPDTVFAVVYNALDCPSPPALIFLEFFPQQPSQDTSIRACVEQDGQGTFDLTTLSEIINFNSGLSVTYYSTNNLGDIINSPDNYRSLAGLVYGRIEGADGCFTDFIPIDLITDTLLQANGWSLTACMMLGGTGTFDLTSVDTNVTGGQPGLNVIWYENNTSPLVQIPNPTTFNSSSTIVYATVSDGLCIANLAPVVLSLSVDGLGTSMSIEACNRGDDTGRFNLTDSDIDIGGVNSIVHWFMDDQANNAIIDPTDFESGIDTIFVIVENQNLCISSPLPIYLNLEYLAITDVDTIPQCDQGAGMGIFDLTVVDNVIINGNGGSVEWYSDNAISVSIPDPTNLMSADGLVYARIVDGECVSQVIEIALLVTNDLNGNSITIDICDQGNGQSNFDLSQSDILISPDGFTVDYYTDPAATMTVADKTNFLSGDATIYAVLRSGNCSSPIIPINLNVDIAVFPPDTTAVECDEGGGFGTFNLTDFESLISGVGSNVQWFDDALASTPITDPLNLNTQPRDVYFIVTNPQGCISAPTVFHLDTDNNLPAFSTSSEACDDGLGNGIFNLDMLITDITSGNPFNVEFYEDNALTLLIPNTSSYSSIAKTIYAITVDGPCRSLPVEIDLSLIPQIVATPTTLQLCDDGSGTASFDLQTIDGAIDNGQGFTVQWYEDNALSNPIVDPANHLSGEASVYAVLTNGNCDSEPVEIPLSIKTLIANSSSDETCDEGAGTGTFDLLSQEATIISNPGETVIWYADAGLTMIIDANSPYNSGDATVYVVVSDGTCSSPAIAIPLTLTDKLPAQTTSLADCDDGDGMLIFNLSTLDALINTGGAGSVQWYEDDAGTVGITDNTNYESGTTIVYAQVEDGPCRSDIIAIDLTVNPLPSADAGLPQQLDCRSPFLDITGSGSTGDFSYTWTTSNGNIISGQNSLVVQVDASGNYTLEIVDNQTGCLSISSVLITEDMNQPVADAGLDSQIDCIDATTQIGTGNTDFGADFMISWRLDGNPVSGTGQFITADQPGTYVVLVENSLTGCENSDSVDVVSAIAELIDLQVEVDDPNCNGANTGCIELLSVAGGVLPYQVSVDQTNFEAVSQICNLSAGNYTFTVQDANGCETSQTVTIQQPQVLQVQIAGENIIDYRSSTTLAANHQPSSFEITTYEWLSDNIVGSAIDSLVAVSGLDEFTVQVNIVDENGCTATDQITVYVRKDFKVFAPNAFSPFRVDAINDRFMLFGDEEIVTNIDELKIYSRWGEKLFERTNLTINDVNSGWDGTFDGQDMNSGTFIFHATVTYVDGTTELISGNVHLID